MKKKKIIEELWNLLELNKRLERLEKRIQRLETHLGTGKVPCQINEGELCDEPYCKFTFYQTLAYKYYKEWLKKIEEEVKKARKS